MWHPLFTNIYVTFCSPFSFLVYTGAVAALVVFYVQTKRDDEELIYNYRCIATRVTERGPKASCEGR